MIEHDVSVYDDNPYERKFTKYDKLCESYR